MGQSLRYIGIALLAISAVVFCYLTMTGMNIELIPIDQSECPPNVGIAPDGTCGIYEDREISGWSIACIVSGILGMISFVAGLIVSRKNG